MRRSRVRITVAAPLIIGTIITLTFGAYILVGTSMSNRIIRDRLISDNHALLTVSSDLLFNPLYELDIWTINSIIDELIDEGDIVKVTVRDSNGEIITESIRETPNFEVESSNQLSNQALALQVITQYETDNYLALFGPISVGPEQIGTLELVFSLASLHASINNLILSMTVTGAITLLVAIFISSLLAQTLRKPIENIVVAANQIGQGNLNANIPQTNLVEPAAIGVALDLMQSNLKELYASLEQQVETLDRRARYLEATSKVARDTASVLDLPVLLNRSINLVNENFDFYRQGLFLVDPSGEWIELNAVSGEDTDETFASDFRLRIGSEGIVGQVAASGTIYVAQDVTIDPLYISDESTTLTRSELALPLHSRGELIGVLDVQSTSVNAFSDEDIAVLQTLADQLALAITNARYFKEAEENLDVLQRAYGELSREKWSDMLESREKVGYYCDASGVRHITSLTENDDYSELDLPTIEIPVVVRGFLIGKIRARKPKGSSEWLKDEIGLMEDLTDQLNLTLESARLFEESQRRASQEQLTSEITSRIRETLDIETILETAVNEIGSAMGLAALEVHIGDYTSDNQE